MLLQKLLHRTNAGGSVRSILSPSSEHLGPAHSRALGNTIMVGGHPHRVKLSCHYQHVNIISTCHVNTLMSTWHGDIMLTCCYRTPAWTAGTSWAAAWSRGGRGSLEGCPCCRPGPEPDPPCAPLLTMWRPHPDCVLTAVFATTVVIIMLILYCFAKSIFWQIEIRHRYNCCFCVVFHFWNASNFAGKN